MIVTVTLNPALDLTYAVDALVPHGTHRVATVAERPGGKGLNVARVLHALGEPVLATGLLGGTTGGRVAHLLAAEGVRSSFTPIAGETRRTVAVVDRADATGFWEPGPTVTPAEWSAFVAEFRELLGPATVVTLSGSLPQGVPIDAYASLIALATAAGVPTVLDTSGPALRAGLLAGPSVAKPNADELAALLHAAPTPNAAIPNAAIPNAAIPNVPIPNVPIPNVTSPNVPASNVPDPNVPDPNVPASNVPGLNVATSNVPPLGGRRPGPLELAEAVRALATGPVVVSRGSAGLFAVAGDEVWECAPPVPVDGNPTGAGDACVAALARGLRDRTPWPVLLSDAVALSSAAVAAPVAGAFDADVYRRTLATAVPATAATPTGGNRARTHR
ncbi:PfkB family carbohydrate kinase [Actinoplanes sp. KI2]|uniref:1-phosphofructokinase family hexose kinase n=1 Tax=Actinoplanes sp. KI2 TaxID=2983315 RepID=UPI0021D5A464|nr:PfkB family carbohydrate kinase [Actinoplanes sp. KI2]MCU7728594.1 PfkB family carbohydrate kinase [Actinoplanes sp. KI2]